MNDVTDADLQGFLDEALPAAQMAEIEAALRDDDSLRERLFALRSMQDAGMHSVAAIWRRHRLSCPTREEIGQMLLGVLDDERAAYIQFHAERIGCRICSANLDDLRRQSEEQTETATTRRRRYFETSVGRMKK